MPMSHFTAEPQFFSFIFLSHPPLIWCNHTSIPATPEKQLLTASVNIMIPNPAVRFSFHHTQPFHRTGPASFLLKHMPQLSIFLLHLSWLLRLSCWLELLSISKRWGIQELIQTSFSSLNILSRLSHQESNSCI